MTVMDDTLAKVLEDRLGALLAARRAGTITLEGEAEMAAISQTMTRPMPPRPPFCVLMAGLPVSGKTTLSRVLTDRGFARLCPDEEMFRRHGAYGVDFPRGVFPTLERPVLEDVAAELREQLKAGHDVVVDHGFWTPEDRTKWRAIATEAGATLPHWSTSRRAMTNSGPGSASGTSSTRTTRIRSTSQKATSSGTGAGSSHRRRTNRTFSTRATLRT